MKCKPYSEITVEIGTQLKTVKITLNIFAVQQKIQVDICIMLQFQYKILSMRSHIATVGSK